MKAKSIFINEREAIPVSAAAKRMGYRGPDMIYIRLKDGTLEGEKLSPRKTFVFVDSVEAAISSANRGL